MKTEKAVVEKIQTDNALLRIIPENPESCESCGCCAALGSSSHLIPLSFADNPLLKDASEGDEATLEINLPNQAVAATLLFGLPLLSMIIFAVLAQSFFPEKELSLVIGGALGLIAGGIEILLLNKIIPALKSGIKVISINK